MWSFDLLRRHLEEEASEVAIFVNEINGLVTLVKPENVEVLITNDILNLIGIDEGRDGTWLEAEHNYEGNRPINFTNRCLSVSLDVIDGSKNLVDGKRSEILGRINLQNYHFGQYFAHEVSCPQYKQMRLNKIHELKLTIKDENDEIINNHDFPIDIEIEFKQS